MDTQQCRKCKALIVFLKTRANKLMPVDASTAIEGDVDYDAARHMSHFATCPFAKEFRKPK